MYCKALGGLTTQQPMRHIVADKGCVILPHRDRGVVERCQRVRLDVANLGGIAFQAVHDVYLLLEFQRETEKQGFSLEAL